MLRQSERDIFDYFAEEVFSDEAEEVRNLLLQVSLLDRIELDTCAVTLPGCQLFACASQSGPSQRVSYSGERSARRGVSAAPAFSELPAPAAAQ